MGFQLPQPRVRRDNVSRWYIPWDELREVQAMVQRADARAEDQTLRRAREAYQESREQEHEEKEV